MSASAASAGMNLSSGDVTWLRTELHSLLGYPDDGQLSGHMVSIPSKDSLQQWAKEVLGGKPQVRRMCEELWRRKMTAAAATLRQPMASPANATHTSPSSTTNTSSATSAAAALQHGRRNIQVKVAAAKPSTSSTTTSASSASHHRSRCNCHALEHSLFTNCTSCGRIICEAEGDGPCFFCGSLVTRDATFINEDFVKHMRRIGGDKEKSESAGGDSSSETGAESEGLLKAEAQRDMLLSYARSDAHRSKVLDIQNDWYEFESNAWLSAEERKAKKTSTEQQLADLERRRQHTVTIDLVNKQVVMHNSDAWEANLQPQPDAPKWTEADTPAGFNTHGASISAAMGGSRQLQKAVDEMKMISRAQYYANDTLRGRAREVYLALKANLRPQGSTAPKEEQTDKPSNPLLTSIKTPHQPKISFSDDEGAVDAAAATSSCCRTSGDDDEPTHCGVDASLLYDDASDSGVCLSMWQPWASLLVLGIKRFEGRGWYTSHRGRLWIASGSREVDPDEVAAIEAEYRQVYGPDAKIPFPTEYPTSSLLGCVDLNACWTQEEFQEYRRNHPVGTENSSSAFVFVCSHPRLLPLPQRISGQHKLWHLPPRLLHTIQPALKPVSQRWRTCITGDAASSSSCTSIPGHEPPFDLWPAPVKPAMPPSASLAKPPNPTIQLIKPGIVLIKKALSIPQQQELIDCCRLSAVSDGANATRLVVPKFTDGPNMNLRMMCYGKHWNNNTNRYDTMDPNGRPIPSLPSPIQHHADRCMKLVSDYLAAHPKQRDDYHLPNYAPDLCIVNYYSSSSGRLGVHQGKSESSASIRAGYPVVSFSIGDTAEFVYGDRYIPEEKLSLGGSGNGAAASESYHKLVLDSGDVLLFGGSARLIYHGVTRILPNTKPRHLFMKQGRINITCRKL